MRIQVTLNVQRETRLPLNCGHQLTGVVYATLERADPDYAQFLHTTGYTTGRESEVGVREKEGNMEGTTALTTAPPTRRFKGFVFGQLRATRSRVVPHPSGEAQLVVAPGVITWQIASPVEQFVTTFAAGLLSQGTLRLGSTTLEVSHVETLPAPSWGSTMGWRCLSPVVACVTDPQRRTPRYLRPEDGNAEWSERLRHNLLAKHRALGQTPPTDDTLQVVWDAAYLEKHRGTKLITYKGIRIVGMMCPLEISGNPALLHTAYSAGLGEKGSAGFGLMEVAE